MQPVGADLRGPSMALESGLHVPPTHTRRPRWAGRRIPFKELQVPQRRPELLEAGTRPHTAVVVHQVPQVRMHLHGAGRSV